MDGIKVSALASDCGLKLSLCPKYGEHSHKQTCGIHPDNDLFKGFRRSFNGKTALPDYSHDRVKRAEKRDRVDKRNWLEQTSSSANDRLFRSSPAIRHRDLRREAKPQVGTSAFGRQLGITGYEGLPLGLPNDQRQGDTAEKVDNALAPRGNRGRQRTSDKAKINQYPEETPGFWVPKTLSNKRRSTGFQRQLPDKMGINTPRAGNAESAVFTRRKTWV